MWENIYEFLKFGFMLGAILASPYASPEDPRLEKDEVVACVDQAKRFMKSSDYSGENESSVITACRDVDADCVAEVGESLHPSDGFDSKKFLTLVRACKGRGMGRCLRALKGKTASHNRREYSQLHDLLKKCD